MRFNCAVIIKKGVLLAAVIATRSNYPNHKSDLYSFVSIIVAYKGN
jgi:hypothetical protein